MEPELNNYFVKKTIQVQQILLKLDFPDNNIELKFLHAAEKVALAALHRTHARTCIHHIHIYADLSQRSASASHGRGKRFPHTQNTCKK
jgi:hypothetical protein